MNEQEVRHLRLHPILVDELDMPTFVVREQKLHVSSGEQIANLLIAILDPIDRVQPRSKTICVEELKLSKQSVLNCTTQSLKESSEQVEYQSTDSEG